MRWYDDIAETFGMTIPQKRADVWLEIIEEAMLETRSKQQSNCEVSEENK